MRRAPAIAALAIPAIAAAVSAGSGQVIEVNNFNATVTTSYVNAAQCAGTDTLHLEWNIAPVSGTFTASGTYRIFASDTAPFTSGDNVNFCPETSTTDPAVNAGQVDSATASTSVQSKEVSGASVATTAKFTCDSASEGKVVYVCAHWYDATPTRRGHASGKFVIQVTAPAKPTGVTAASGDGRLELTWTASDPAAGAEADHYVAEATPVGGGTTIFSSSTKSTSVTIRGLTNFTDYEVAVQAFSVGGNPSELSDPAFGTPMPSAGFWEVYGERGGVETGGCGTGSAGALALLGTALILALRRRTR